MRDPWAICVLVGIVGSILISLHAKLTGRKSNVNLFMANFLSIFGGAYSIYFLWLVIFVLKSNQLGELADKKGYLVLGGLSSIAIAYTALERAFEKSSGNIGDKNRDQNDGEV